MSNIVPTLLVPTQLLASADTSLYTAPTSTTVKIGRAVFCNTSASSVTISAGITTGGSLGDLLMISDYPLPANSTYVSPELAGAVFPANSQIHAFASVANVMTLTISGLTIQ